MPAYDYCCSKCGKTYERTKPIKDSSEDTCECGGTAKVVFHPPHIIFTGTGFYKTDSRLTK